jgi:hemerythrin-like domain-containing protein
MDPTQCLRDDHQLILEVLSCFEIALASARAAGDGKPADFLSFVEFFRGFADEYHHQKEEGSLFPALGRAGLPLEAGPVACMLEEHRMGRAHIAAIGAAIAAGERGEGGAMKTILAQGEAYIDLLRSHIAKEDGILFEMAAGVIEGDDATRLLREFDEAEANPDYLETVNRCRSIARGLIETST